MPNTPRLGIPTPAAGDAPNIPAHLAAMATVLDGLAPISSGVIANRPVSTAVSPGVVNRIFRQTDGDKTVWIDTGTGWEPYVHGADPRLSDKRVPTIRKWIRRTKLTQYDNTGGAEFAAALHSSVETRGGISVVGNTDGRTYLNHAGLWLVSASGTQGGAPANTGFRIAVRQRRDPGAALVVQKSSIGSTAGANALGGQTDAEVTLLVVANAGDWLELIVNNYTGANASFDLKLEATQLDEG